MERLLAKDNQAHEDFLPQEVVDTFFGKSKPPEPQKPTEPQKKPPKKTEYKAVVLAVIFCMVLTAAFMIGYFVSSKNLRNEVRAEPTIPIEKKTLPDYSKLVYDGLYDRNIIKNVSFEGDAKAKSQMLQKSMKLVNDKRLGWARLSITFDKPLDLTKSVIMILGKSSFGTKAISVILGGVDNSSYEAPFIKYTSKWEWKKINLQNHLGLKNIKQLSIEYGSQTVGNAGDTSIYIKEIGIKKEGGI